MSRHVLTVDRAGGYRTISAALRDARAGTLISVAPGRYAESLELTEAVTIAASGTGGVVEVVARTGGAVRVTAAVRLTGLVLRGQDPEVPALDVASGPAVVEDCEIIGAAWTAVLARAEGSLVLRGCRVTNPDGAGVVVTSPSASTIEDCVVEHVGAAAVVLAERGDAVIRDCTLRHAKGNGISANGNARGVVERCDISGTDRPGIALEGGSSVRISDTTVRDSASGVFLSTNAVLEDCRIGNTAGAGITVAGGADPVLRRCRTIRTGGAGVRVTGRSRGVFEDCEVANATGAGIHVDEASGPAFRRTTVRGGTGPGLLITDGATAEFDRIEVRDVAAAGVRVESSANPLVRRAVLESCRGHGVEVTSNGRGRLEDCEVRAAGRTGLSVSAGGSPSASWVQVRSPRAAGVSVAPGGVASLRDCAVSGAGESGVVVRDGGELILAQSHVYDSKQHGVLVEPGGRARLTAAELTDNGADGLRVDSSAAVGVVDCTVSGNSGSGIRVTVPGSRLSVENLTSADNGEADALSDRPRTDPGGGEPLRELAALVGLAAVKHEVKALARLEKTVTGRHLILTGPPGTGKTTVARLYGGILAELGVLSRGHLVEVTGAELDATGTTDAVGRARGGVLFVDGAPDFGQRAVGTLTELMDDHDDIVVVVAGRSAGIEPGLAARFARTIEFEHHTTAELVEIVERMCTARQYLVPAETREALSVHFGQVTRAGDVGNGHTAREVCEEVLARHAIRLANEPRADHPSRVLLPADVPGDPADDTGGALAAALAKLDAMIGLGSVKETITDLVHLISAARRRRAAGLPVPEISNHLVLTGAPGTGKSAVARRYGELLTALNVLRGGHLVEVACAGLLGHYVGHTTQLTRETFERARGGVLFIDEAHTTAPAAGDFCQEAADTLVQLMDDHRDDTVVVIAGHSPGMREFLRTDPGLAKRFTRYVEFPNYTTDELVTIVHRMATTNGYECAAETIAAVREHFAAGHHGETAGNARHAEQVLEAMMTRQARRLSGTGDPTVRDLRLLLPVDLP